MKQSKMVRSPLSLLHDRRQQVLAALAVFSAALTIVLASVSFSCPCRATAQPATFDVYDIDAKALRPQQHIASRGPSRSIRFGQSDTPEFARGLYCTSLRRVAQSVVISALQNSVIFGYLAQRTRLQRAPPLLVG